MSDDRALKSWVSDQLHGLLGFAEGNLASYVVGLGALTTSTMTNIVFPFFASINRFSRDPTPFPLRSSIPLPYTT